MAVKLWQLFRVTHYCLFTVTSSSFVADSQLLRRTGSPSACRVHAVIQHLLASHATRTFDVAIEIKIRIQKQTTSLGGWIKLIKIWLVCVILAGLMTSWQPSSLTTERRRWSTLPASTTAKRRTWTTTSKSSVKFRVRLILRETRRSTRPMVSQRIEDSSAVQVSFPRSEDSNCTSQVPFPFWSLRISPATIG